MSSTAQGMPSGHSLAAGTLSRLCIDWRLHWFLLLLPVALLLPAFPIDETRYLAVAWEMYGRLDFGVLYLNGEPYADKGPLLFWLINIAWLFFGAHLWVVRVFALLVSVIFLVLFQRLALRLNADERLAQRAALMLSGIVFFSLFSSAVMFDVLLGVGVLIALHGALDFDGRHWNWGIGAMALGLGLGLLTKGPVVLLDTAFVLLLGPWWSATAHASKTRWYASSALGIAGAIVIALCWAVPAALRGGTDYAHAIFLGQTVNRVANSFAHARPFWWYLPLLPAMLLPWTISVRAPWATWRSALADTRVARFAIAWFVPTFIVFCFVSGKQPHYLLPLLPAIALYLSHVLEDRAARIDGRGFGILLIVFAAGASIYLFVAQSRPSTSSLTASATLLIMRSWPLWPILLGLLGAYLCIDRRAQARLQRVAMVSVLATVVLMFGVIQVYAANAGLAMAATRIENAQSEHRSIISLGSHHGLFEFAGRLSEPLNVIKFKELQNWCSARPSGEVVTFYKKYQFPAKPVAEFDLLTDRVRFWRAADLCATLDSKFANTSADDDNDE